MTRITEHNEFPLSTSAGARRNYGVRLLGASLAGGAAHASVLAAGYLFFRRQVASITAECEKTDCQPQYYLFAGMSYAFVLLPFTFLVGCAAIIWAIRRATGGSDRARTAQHHAIAGTFLLAFGLCYLCLLALTTDDGATFLAWQIGIAIGPALVAGSITYFTITKGGGPEVEVRDRPSTEPDPK